MSKYEIMLILDPNSDDKIISEIAKSTFKKSANIEKLERTELAYEINKSKTAAYYLVTVEATGEEINEFDRKSNIAKNIWRHLSVNLDSEKGLNRKAKPKRVRRPFIKKTHNEASNEQNKSTSANEEGEKPKRTTKKDESKSSKSDVKKTTKTTKKEKEDK